MKLVVLTFILLSALCARAETNIIAEIEKNPEAAKKLGLAKLTAEEKAEWNRLILTICTMRANELVKESSPTTAAKVPPQNAEMSIWFTKANLDSQEVITLENGAVFQFITAFAGAGRRDVALVKEGSRWSLWIASKSRIYRGELLKGPQTGRALGGHRTSVLHVTSDGHLVTLTDGRAYEINDLDRIETSLWLLGMEIIALDDGRLFDPEETGPSALVEATLAR